jgi:hypothetical protein
MATNTLARGLGRGEWIARQVALNRVRHRVDGGGGDRLARRSWFDLGRLVSRVAEESDTRNRNNSRNK